MDPDEGIINECYRQRQVSNLLQMAKVLASDDCLCVHMEQILGNPEMVHSLPEPCGECPVCRNDKVFFQINKEGTKSVSLDLFIFGNHGIQGTLISHEVGWAWNVVHFIAVTVMSLVQRTELEQVSCWTMGGCAPFCFPCHCWSIIRFGACGHMVREWKALCEHIIMCDGTCQFKITVGNSTGWVVH